MVATNKMEKGRRGVLLELYVAYCSIKKRKIDDGDAEDWIFRHRHDEIAKLRRRIEKGDWL